MFLVILTGPQKPNQELAARRIFKTRNIKRNRVRLFQLPNINLIASSYINLNYWQENDIEPLILKTISDKDIQLLVVQEGEGEISLLHLPCHTQVVKSCQDRNRSLKPFLY